MFLFPDEADISGPSDLEIDRVEVQKVSAYGLSVNPCKTGQDFGNEGKNENYILQHK